MPTIFSHSIVGTGFARFFRFKEPKKVYWIAAGLAALPDADALFMKWVQYDSPLGHRGITHSIFFAVCVGAITAFIFYKKNWVDREHLLKAGILFFLAIISHPFLDAFTDGGHGVAFFAPFDNTRYFFAWRPIPVAPFSPARLFTLHGAYLFLAEVGMLWLFTIGSLSWNNPSNSAGKKIFALFIWMAEAVIWIIAIVNL